MKRYSIIVCLLLLLFLSVFVLIEQWDPVMLTMPHELYMQAASIGAALAGIVFLVADVLLPVPSTLIMVTNGALFGVFAGSLLSLLGSLGAGLAGFAIGRRGESFLARYVSRTERERANHLLAKWGVFAIILTRPVPLLAETVTIMAGASRMRWRHMALATILGSLPAAVLYAITGATAASWDNAVLTFGLVLMVAGFFWIIGRYLHLNLSVCVSPRSGPKGE
jgi:uncharacterized membrane protein YdjX (TVP38/TMEM64 family)